MAATATPTSSNLLPFSGVDDHRWIVIVRLRRRLVEEPLWGVSASDSDLGYVIWGDPLSRSDLDGTVVPCAAGGSLMFAPEICLPALRYMREKFGELVYGRYGFADAFNPQTLWVDSDVVGIDIGITLLSAENLRGGSIWRWFQRSADIQRAVQQLFQPY